MGTNWTLVSLQSRKPLPKSEITLGFTSATEVFGSAGCNQYFGKYRITEARLIKFRGVQSTAVACLNPDDTYDTELMRQEDQYLRLLSSPGGWKLSWRDGRLVLGASSGRSLLEFRRAAEPIL